MSLATGTLSSETPGSGPVFELRTYHAVEGRLPALLARFRDHTTHLFTKHGITNVAYWTPTDDPIKANTLVYIVSFPSREAAIASWKAFQEDLAWIKAKMESEASGEIVKSIDSTFMELTDFSPKI